MKCPCCDQEIKEEEETIIRLLKKILDKLEAIDKKPVYVPYQPFNPCPDPIQPWYPPIGTPIWTDTEIHTNTPMPPLPQTWCESVNFTFAQDNLDMEANETPNTMCGFGVRYGDSADA